MQKVVLEVDKRHLKHILEFLNKYKFEVQGIEKVAIFYLKNGRKKEIKLSGNSEISIYGQKFIIENGKIISNGKIFEKEGSYTVNGVRFKIKMKSKYGNFLLVETNSFNSFDFSKIPFVKKVVKV